VQIARFLLHMCKKNLDMNQDQEEEEETEEKTEDEPTMTNVQSINGIEIEIIRDTANEGSKVTEQILHKKEDCQSLIMKEELAELYEKFTKTVHRKYGLIPLTLSNENKLNGTYNLEMLIRKTRQAHTDFDMHDVLFTIVIPDRDDSTGMRQTSTTKDLYKNFPSISIEEVAISNVWYP
jgi:hypothetical protein